MRVLLFPSSYAPRRGGLELVASRLASGLRAHGHEVTVATNRYPRGLRSYEFLDGVPVYRQLYPQLLPSSQWRSTRDVVKGLILLPLAPLALLRLALLMRRYRPDVVNVHYFSSTALYALLVARLARIPVVLSFHGSDLSSIPRSPWYLCALTWACRISGACTACSEDLAARLGRLVPSDATQMIVAHNGVDSAHQDSMSLALPDVFALVIARLVPAKGVDLAIKGVADLKNRGLDLSLVIVGDGPLRVELEKLARQLDVESCVRFMGSLHGPAVSSALRRSRCLIVPSRAEGFGIVCLEAMIAGRPVVASSTGGIPEIVADGETGWLVAPGDVRALADAVATVLQSPSVADEMGLRGRSRALTLFSWERMVEKYLASYFCALGGRLDRTKAPLA